MNVASIVAPLSVLCALMLAALSLVRRRPSPATWFFVAGMLAVGADGLVAGAALRAQTPQAALRWITAVFVLDAVVPGPWLGFSLAYSRAEGRKRISKWAVPLALAAVVPAAITLISRDRLFEVVVESGVWQPRFGAGAGLLNAWLLIALALILLNLEQTFRSAIGIMRWRLKFVVLGVVVILGTRLYVHSQELLFSTPDIGALWSLEATALLIGCMFLTVAYVRTGWKEVPVYPSSVVVRSSLTVLIVGGYLFAVGVLAQVAGRLGGVDFSQIQTAVVLVGLAGLGVLVLSDRARQRLRTVTARHFGKARHDSVKVWTALSRQLGAAADAGALGRSATRLIADAFDVLTVNAWFVDLDGQFALVATTGGQNAVRCATTEPILAGLRDRPGPFDLDRVRQAWAADLRQLNPGSFPNGGNRLCVSLRAGDHVLGALVLADRISGVPYSVEETDLLKCIADQVTSVLLNLRLADEVARSRELDAFRTMSAFFVHDLKNAAASLNLMLRNLPDHFDDPAFRQDAIRGIGNAAGRIDGLIGRLNELKEKPEIFRAETDLNAVVAEALDQINSAPNVAMIRSLEPVPAILGDRDQLRSIVTNLVANARDAVGADGRIEVHTTHRPGAVVLSVADNGSGMSEDFVAHSLFRPFQSTKKSGLGIGLFQTRAIVQAHGGQIHVESAVGRGTTFTATFPVREQP
jgi:putative PEP-CTERM system histidine kinase